MLNEFKELVPVIMYQMSYFYPGHHDRRFLEV